MEKLSGKRFKTFLLCIVTFFYSGLISIKMPGTIGSIAAMFVAMLLPHKACIYMILTIATFLVGTIASQVYVSKFDSNTDPGYIVIDEACGIFLGCYILSMFSELSNINIFLNFILFRFFDIFKPFPIKSTESIFSKNNKTLGFGIMIDDVIAAIYATLIQEYFFRNTLSIA